ncbi:MAG: metallophosphoesterase [Promethearchaeia archaeon]
MDLSAFTRKKTKWLLFLIYNILLFSFWAVFILWSVKSKIIWAPEEFLLYLAGLIILTGIPLLFFVKGLGRVIKSMKISEKLHFTKRFIYSSLFISVIFSAFSLVALFLFSVPTASFSYNYDDGPYLIWSDDPKTTMTIIWTTEEPSTSELKYGVSKNNMKNVDNQAFSNRHVIKLEGLEPGRKYYYQIPEFSEEIYSFRTAPSDDQAFNFTVIGDTQNPSSAVPSNYGAVIDAMASYQYDFILHAGDFTVDASDMVSWHTLFTNMVRHGTSHPYMLAIGNHDYGADIFGRNFKYFFPYDYVDIWGHYYNFDFSNAHFVMLDIFQNQLDWGGYITELQELWLRNELKNNQDKWLIVMLHAAPFSTGDFNMNYKLIDQLIPIFYEYKVDVILSGHDHHYESFWMNSTEEWGGTYYFVTGGGGGDLDTSIMQREHNPWHHTWHNASIEPYQDDYYTVHNQLYGELCHHFMHFTIDGTTMDIQAIRTNGSIMQEFHITK